MYLWVKKLQLLIGVWLQLWVGKLKLGSYHRESRHDQVITLHDYCHDRRSIGKQWYLNAHRHTARSGIGSGKCRLSR